MKNAIVYLGFYNFKTKRRGVENVILIQGTAFEGTKFHIFFDDDNKIFKWDGFICIGIKHDKFRFFNLNKVLYKIKNNYKIIIHAHNYLMASFYLGSIDIFTVHDGLFYQAKMTKHKLKFAFYAIEKFVYKKSKIVHFISEYTKKESLFNGNNFKVIQNSTPFELWKSKFTPKDPYRTEKIKVFAVRSIEQRANIPLLIEFAKVTNVELFIAGRGPLLDKYKTETEKNHNIHFLGYLSDFTVCSYYYYCDIVVMPAIFGEGFGLPIIEGYLFNKPVIASNTCATPEVINCSKFLFENNIYSLVETFNYSLDNRLKYNFIEYYEKHFSIQAISNQYKKLYLNYFQSDN